MRESTARDPGVLGLLLQRHAELLRRNTIFSAVNRVLLFIIALVPVTGLLHNYFYAGLLCLDAMLIAVVWTNDRRRASYELRGLEESLSRYAGGDIEDVFIRARGIPMSSNFFLLSVNEPIYWLTLAVTSNLLPLLFPYLRLSGA